MGHATESRSAIIRAGFGAQHPIFGEALRTAIQANTACPVHFHKWLREQNFPIRPVKDVKESILIGIQQKLPRFSLKLRVNQKDGRVRIPIVQVDWSDL